VTEPTTPLIGIVGGGAAGALLAANLLRLPGPPRRVVVWEPRSGLGEGVAYSTTDPHHRLNVPAGRMSGLVDDPDDFRRWADVADYTFVLRREYAGYLRDLLRRCADAAPADALTHVVARATRVQATSSGFDVTDELGATRHVNAVLLATGWAAPGRLPGQPAAATAEWVTDPWAPGALDGLVAGDTVATIGTGLTFVDVALTLAARGIDVVGVSRTGRLPVAHPREPLPPLALDLPDDDGAAVPLSRLIGLARRADGDPRQVVDAFRSATPRLWRALGETGQDQFLRHLQRRWETTRHRMAPDVAATLERLRAAGVVRTYGGGVTAVEEGPSGVIVTAGRAGPFPARCVINCTGPVIGPVDHLLVPDPDGRALVRPGPHGLGLAVDRDTGQACGPVRHVYAAGPLRRGIDWEATAIPEIRRQAHDTARALLAGVATS
jgi:uncharacterized NAD(P)/FAD-binding protein YdhS